MNVKATNIKVKTPVQSKDASLEGECSLQSTNEDMHVELNDVHVDDVAIEHVQNSSKHKRQTQSQKHLWSDAEARAVKRQPSPCIISNSS